MPGKQVYLMNVVKCAACGQDHVNLPFLKLVPGDPDNPSGNRLIATCPITRRDIFAERIEKTIGNVSVTKPALAELAEWIIKAKFKEDAFGELADEICDIIARKNHDYGDAWQRYGIFTPLIRINDKILRVKTLSSAVALVAGENIKDTLRDIVAYGLLALLRIQFEEDISTQPKEFTAEDILKRIDPGYDAGKE